MICDCKRGPRKTHMRGQSPFYLAQEMVHDGKTYELAFCWRCGGFYGWTNGKTLDLIEPPDNVVLGNKATGEILWPPRKRKLWKQGKMTYAGS